MLTARQADISPKSTVLGDPIMANFLSLPAEIRDKIYHDLFTNTALYHFQDIEQHRGQRSLFSRDRRLSHLTKTQIITKAAPDRPNILLTCQTCYREAHVTYTRLVTIVIVRLKSFVQLARLLSPTTRRHLQSLHVRDSSISRRLDYDELLVHFPSLKTFNLGRHWRGLHGVDPFAERLLQDGSPETDAELVAHMANGLASLEHTRVTTEFPIDVFVTLACKARGGSAGQQLCSQYHGQICRYCTVWLNHWKVFRCYSQCLDDRVVNAVLRGERRAEETGLLVPPFGDCVRSHDFIDPLWQTDLSGVLDLELYRLEILGEAR